MRLLNLFGYRKKLMQNSSSRLYLKLRAYFMLTFTLVVLMPFGIFGALTYDNYKKDMQENISTIANENITQVSSAISFILDNMGIYSRTILDNIENSDFFRQNILSRSSRPLSHSDLEAFKEQLDRKLNISKNTQVPVENIYIIYNNELYTLYSKHVSKTVLGPTTWDNWIKAASQATDEHKLIGTNMRFYEDGSYTYVTSFVKSIKDETNENLPSCIFLVDIEYESIASAVNVIRSSNFSGSEIYMVDESNNIMFSSNLPLLTTELDEFLVRNVAKRPEGFLTDKIDGKNVHISNRSIPIYHWKVISVIPIDESLKYTFFMKNYLVLLLVLCFIVIYAFSFIIKMIFLNPINELSTAVYSYSRNSYSSASNSSTKENEPARNQDAHNLSDIQSLIHKVYSSRLEQKETQLKSLQSQINPHFLYNTLESIRGAALFHGIPGIAEMSRCLSSLFRYSISSDLLVSVRSEIQNIEEYIAIQNFRHDNKFILSYNIPEKLYDHKILKLTLQPIVENSIKHGLELKLGKGRIKISILSLENTIRIEISDDGMGITPEKVRELNRTLSECQYSEQNILSAQNSENGHITSAKGTGIGAQNVNSRIKLYFGSQYGITYKECQSGACVEIILPSITENITKINPLY
ncbi:MAG: histidine kinase [Clostridia bacterium]|nr:histidine kinase [Clostridia bacterium]